MVKIYIESYGCSANLNDAEIMAGLLEKSGFLIVTNPEIADVIIVNTCIVKSKTQTKMYKVIRDLAKQFPHKKLIIAGCLPQVKLELPVNNVSLIGPHNIKDIVKVVDLAVKGKNVELIDKNKQLKLMLPKISKNPVVNIVQILEGCTGNCSYCIVKQAKPVLFSFPEELILKEVKAGLKNNAKEVWITSQDNAAYGLENNKNSKLPELLKNIDKIQGKFLVRVGMMNPNNVLPILDELIDSYKSKKIFKFIHIPVQSGNNEILKLMNRKYKVEDFKKIIKKLREQIPEITISTDIICGFPSETEKQFNDSLDLIKEIKPDVINISRFGPRPNTLAEKMPNQVHGSITKKRSTKLTNLFNKTALEKNKSWIGWKGEILVDEIGKNKTMVGRNFAYKPVVIKANKKFLGKFVEVEIKDATAYDLRGIVK